ncbi:MAG: hypothetical protein AB8B69_19650 [Chitinophagales bacterium]
MAYITKDNLFMNELNKQELLEKFLEGKLTQEEEQQFQKLQESDASLPKDMDFLQRFMNVQMHFGRDELKRELFSLEKELQKEEVLSFTQRLEVSLQGMVKKLHYSMQELASFFQPQPEYQRVLAYANRGEDLKIAHPISGIDAGEVGGLHFEIDGKFNAPLQLTVENNQKQILLSTSIDVHETVFFVKVESLPPGRYYWKLKGEKETIIREFFMQKDLIPK